MQLTMIQFQVIFVLSMVLCFAKNKSMSIMLIDFFYPISVKVNCKDAKISVFEACIS